MLTDAVARLWGETPQKLTPCAASGNNQVFIAEDRDGNRVIVKRYFPLQPDERDRLDAECRFLRHAAATGRVPRLLGRDDIARIALHEWIDGEKAAPDAEALEQAADFITALNLPGPIPDLPDAAEAAFTTLGHLRVVEHRLARLSAVTAPNARALIRDLTAVWARLTQHLDGASQGRRVVSPSDFGFHNALLRPDGRWVFFDFEYGGWDDIAKLVNDVFLQPAVPVPFDLFEPFLDRVIGNDPTERRRISLLRPVFAVKWCCIMLNPFLPDTAARGAFADPGTDAATRRTTQLEKARAAFQRLTEMI